MPVSILPSGGDVPIDLRYQLIGVSRAVHERGHVRLVEGARIGHVERAQVGRPDDRTARIAVRLLPVCGASCLRTVRWDHETATTWLAYRFTTAARSHARVVCGALPAASATCRSSTVRSVRDLTFSNIERTGSKAAHPKSIARSFGSFHDKPCLRRRRSSSCHFISHSTRDASGCIFSLVSSSACRMAATSASACPTAP